MINLNMNSLKVFTDGSLPLLSAVTENEKRILKLCGVDENIYVKSGNTTDVTL